MPHLYSAPERETGRIAHATRERFASAAVKQACMVLRWRNQMESMLLPPESRDWSELPMDAFSVIFAKLGAIELLMGAGLVCHSWLHAAKLPHLWQCVEMVHHEALSLKEPIVMSEMARAAVDRSDGRLEAFEGQWSPKLKRLCLVSCYSVYKEAFIEFIAKCPLIEDIALINCGSVVFHALNVITGKSFPQLKRFELRTAFERPCYGFDVPLGIPTVRHLQHLILGGIIDIDNEEPPALTLILLASGSAMSSRSSMLRTLRAKCAKIKIRVAVESMDALPVPVPEKLSPETRDWSELPLDALSVVFGKLPRHRGLHGRRPRVPLVAPSCQAASPMVMRRHVALAPPGRVAEKLRHGEGRRGPLRREARGVQGEEDLTLYSCRNIDGDVFVVAGKACRRMKRLHVRWCGALPAYFDGDEPVGIATMRELRHLTLEGIGVSQEKLMAIVDGCPQLDLLHVSGCPGLAAVDDALQAKCAGIKSLTLRPYQELESSIAI
uniref:F-box domain-containing protein n=1 Tax=Oryza nivara TaxID=4536 RepID=A0A0E0I853_ORYNI